jgi:hypothetical protein
MVDAILLRLPCFSNWSEQSARDNWYHCTGTVSQKHCRECKCQCDRNEPTTHSAGSPSYIDTSMILEAIVLLTRAPSVMEPICMQQKGREQVQRRCGDHSMQTCEE